MKTAVIFPGQGAQKVGMGKDLHENFSAARRVYEEASESLKLNMAKLCFEGPESELTLTQNTQPAVLTASVAALRVLESEAGIEPSLTAGHSLGEYTALIFARALNFAEALSAVRQRGAFMQMAVPEGEGAMTAVIGMDAEKVEEICAQVREQSGRVVVAANYNSPEQTVISGHADAVGKASKVAEESGAKRVVPLKVSAPFHSPLMEPAAEKMQEYFERVTFNDASCPVISNVDAEPHTEAGDFASLLVKQIVMPVRWAESMRRLKEGEVELAVEVGPGKVLSGLMRRIDRDVKTANVEDTASLNKTLAML